MKRLVDCGANKDPRYSFASTIGGVRSFRGKVSTLGNITLQYLTPFPNASGASSTAIAFIRSTRI